MSNDAFLAAGGDGKTVASAVGPEPLRRIQKELQIMMASAVAEGGEWVEGYRIKTGALHRLIGMMQEFGYPVSMPALQESRDV